MLENLRFQVEKIFEVSKSLPDYRVVRGLTYVTSMKIYEEYEFLRGTRNNKLLIERINESFENAGIIDEMQFEGTSPNFVFYDILLNYISSEDKTPDDFISFLNKNSIIVYKHGAYSEYQDLIRMGLDISGGGRKQPVYRIKMFNSNIKRKGGISLWDINEGLKQYLNVITIPEIKVGYIHLRPDFAMIDLNIELKIDHSEAKKVIDCTIKRDKSAVKRFMNKNRKSICQILEQEDLFKDHKNMKWSYYGNSDSAEFRMPDSYYEHLKANYIFKRITNGYRTNTMSSDIRKLFMYEPIPRGVNYSCIRFRPQFKKIEYSKLIDKLLNSTDEYIETIEKTTF